LIHYIIVVINPHYVLYSDMWSRLVEHLCSVVYNCRLYTCLSY